MFYKKKQKNKVVNDIRLTPEIERMVNKSQALKS